jgi:RNA polymerase sigma-70 factor (ECF subfamily)
MRALYEEHALALVNFVSRLVGGDRQRAEDIVQETLVRAWRNADKLDLQSGRRLRPWLITVARRIAIDEYRSGGARPEEVYDIDPDAFSTPDESERMVRSVTVMAALRELSPPYREILLHTYFYGRSRRPPNTWTCRWEPRSPASTTACGHCAASSNNRG